MQKVVRTIHFDLDLDIALRGLPVRTINLFVNVAVREKLARLKVEIENDK